MICLFTWNDIRIQYFRRAADRCSYHYDLAQQILPMLDGCKRLLDVGCGLGDLACQLACLGFCVTGADVSEEAILSARALAREKGLSNVTFLQADMENEVVPGHFDALLFCQYGHMENAAKIAQRHNCRRLILVCRESLHHSFHQFSEPIERSSDKTMEDLTAHCSHTYRSCTLSFPQPLTSCDDAAEFLRQYDTSSPIDPSQTTSLLKKTQDLDFPVCIPQEKQLGIHELRWEEGLYETSV